MLVEACSTAVWDVLVEPARRRILDLLLDGERTVGEVVDAVGLSQPAVSKHLRVLRDAGAVEARVDGPRRVYRLRAESLREVDDWLTPYRAAWAARLDALAAHLDDMEARDDTDQRRRARRPRAAR